MSAISETSILIAEELKQLKAAEDRNRKLILITDIFRIRKLMGYENTGKDFDRLYDMPLFDLCGLSIKYADEGFRFAKNLKLKTI